MHDVARSFKMRGYDLKDNPEEIINFQKYFFKEPMLLNINTNRLFWHSGAGKDSDEVFDRYESEKKILGNVAEELDKKLENKIKTKWEKQLEKL